METIKSGENKFYIEQSGEMAAIIEFVPGDNEKQIIVNHTFVSEDLRGEGLGEALIEKVAEFAREQNLKVVAECPFARTIMEEEQKYQDILA